MAAAESYNLIAQQQALQSIWRAGKAHLIDVVLSLLSFSNPVLDHSRRKLGVVEGVDQHLIIQNVALGLLQQPQDLVLQLLFSHTHPTQYLQASQESIQHPTRLSMTKLLYTWLAEVK